VPTYFVTLESTGVKAEVEAPTTRSARTVYLDYLTRNKLVPWVERQNLREEVIVDRIESGQVPIDVNLSYSLEGGGVGPDEEFSIGPQVPQPPQTPETPVEYSSSYQPSVRPIQVTPTMGSKSIVDPSSPFVRTRGLSTISDPSLSRTGRGLGASISIGSKIAKISRSNLSRGRI